MYFGGENYTDVVIQENDFVGTGSQGIFQAGASDFTNALINGNYFGSGITTGINMNGLISPIIEDNTFEVIYAAMQIGANGGFIRNNIIDGVNQVGVDFSGTPGFGVQAWGLTLWANSEDLTISGNTFTGITNPAPEPGELDFFAAIGLAGNFGPGIIVEQNTIEGNSLGIRMNTDQTDIEIINNAIVDNTVGILNQNEALVNANCNWWGSTDFNEIVSLVEGNVDISTFLMNSTLDPDDPDYDCTGEACWFTTNLWTRITKQSRMRSKPPKKTRLLKLVTAHITKTLKST